MPARLPGSRRIAALLATAFSCAIVGGALAAQAPEPEQYKPRGPAPDPAIPGIAELEARDTKIGRITIVVEDIFDRDDPRENHGLFLLADRLHLNSKESTIRAQLVFREGERLRASALQETERILRTKRYLYDAWIRPVAYDGQRADIEVRVRDVWTLNPGIQFGRRGGKNSSGFKLQDENFLGRGKNLQVSRKNDVDRTTTAVEYEDPNVLGTWWQFFGEYADQSDGKTKRLQFGRPFYSLDARWSFGTSALDSERTESRYDLGQIVDQYAHRQESYAISGGWSPPAAGAWTRRYLVGGRYERDRFERLPLAGVTPAVLPDGRRFSYPFVAFELIEDAFDKTRNQDQLARTEDVYYGVALRAEAGYMSNSFGADRSAAVLGAAIRTGHRITDRQSLFLDAGASGRLESGATRNLLGYANARYYWRWRPRRVLYAALETTATRALDADSQLLLGGEDGLRGYPLRYQGGTSRSLFTLEQRIYTNWFPFRLFNVGGAVFFDAGRTWGRGPVNTASLGLLKDVGLGLRFGNSRSGLGNVVHVDFSYALDGDPTIKKFQVTVETKRSF